MALNFNALNDPSSIAGGYQQGYAFGTQVKQKQQAEADQNALRALAPQVMQGDVTALQQAGAIDPGAAKEYDAIGAGVAQRSAKAAEYVLDAVKRGNPQEIQARYAATIPTLTQIGAASGKVPSPTFTPEMVPLMEQLVATAQGRAGPGPGSQVQSTYVDAAGNRVGIMRDGSTQVLGQNAPNNQIIDTGNGFVGVNKGNLSAAPVMLGGPAPQAAAQAPPAAPQAAPTTFTGGDGAQVQIDPSLPPEVQASIRAQESQWASAPNGAQAQIGPAQALPPALDYANGGQVGGQLRSAPKQASPIEQERLRLAQEANDRAAASANRPSALQERIDLARDMGASPEQLQAIVTGNASTKGPSAAEQKDAMARKAKQPQLQNAVRGLSRIESALQGLNGGLIDTGPADAKIQRFTKAGQELEAAVGGIQNSFLSLTRVPGIGSQSDLEARIANMQYPALDKDPEVNRRTMENLRAFAEDLQAAYQIADAAPPAQAGEGNQLQTTQAVVNGPRRQRATNPQTGQILELVDGAWVPAQ